VARIAIAGTVGKNKSRKIMQASSEVQKKHLRAKIFRRSLCVEAGVAFYIKHKNQNTQ
jgi:hypothetical protein